MSQPIEAGKGFRYMIRSQSNKQTPTTIKQSISIKISSSANITISNVTKNLTFAFPDGFDHLVLHTAHHSSNNHCSQTGLGDLDHFDDNGNFTLRVTILTIDHIDDLDYQN